MTAKKTAARKTSGTKATKTKTSARKAVKPSAVKAAAKSGKPAAIAKRAAKPAAPAPAKSAKPAEKAPVAKKPAVAARAKPAPSASFDPDRRLELIAAAARRRKKVTAKPAPAPIAIVQQREPSPVERHRFSVGDQVRVVSTSGMWFKHGIDYRVTAALPPQAGKLQYRIKNEQEPFERVVSESQLASAQAPAPHAQF